MCDEEEKLGRSTQAALARRLLEAQQARGCAAESTDAIVDEMSPSRYPAGDDEPGDAAEAGHPPVASGREDDMARGKKRRADLGKQLRELIERSGLTRAQIAKRADVSYSVVHSFAAGKTDIQLRTASKLIDVIGAELGLRRAQKGAH